MDDVPLDTIHVLYLGPDSDSTAAVADRLEAEHDALEVRTATSTVGALACIETTHVDCLVSAFDLDGADGIDFLNELRDQRIELPFVLFPDTTGNQIASRAVAAGVDRYRPNTTIEESCAQLAADIVDVVGERTQQTDMLDRMTDGFLALDDQWRFRYLNEKGRQVICEAAGQDWPVEELQGRVIWEVIPEVVDTPFYANYHEAMETQEPVTFEEYYEPLDSWFEVRAFPSPTGLSVFFYDATDRREYEIRLERHEKVLKQIYRVIADKNRTFEEKVSKLLSIGREELEMQYGTLSRLEGEDYVFEVVTGPDDSAVETGDRTALGETYCERAIETKRRLVLTDVTAEAPDLTDREGYSEMGVESYLGTPVFVDDEVTGTFCFYDTEPRSRSFSGWDVTLVDLMGNWISYEREREQRKAELERERNRLDEFASVISHDLRNPLNTAQLRLQQVAEECNSDHVDAVDRSLQRMDDLIRDVLAMARLGKQVVDPEQVLVEALLADAWETAGSDAATLQIEDGFTTIVGDESRLQRLFENLFRNAIEHATDEDGYVTVRVGRLAEGTGLFLEDDGPGVPAEDRETIFEWGHTSHENGTGFGLATVEQIVDAHGGSIQITDGESGGARFEIRGIPVY